MNIQNQNKNPTSFFSSLAYCISLAWKTSKFYTIIRAFAVCTNALLSIAVIFLTRTFFDMISVQNPDSFRTLIIIMFLMTGVTIFNKYMNRLDGYVQELHGDLISRHLRTNLFTKMLGIDIEFFDSPNYLNTMNALMRDYWVLSQIIWHLFAGIGAFITLVSAWVILSTHNIMYAIVMTLLVIPSTIINHYYVKKVYKWRLDNDKVDRKLAYVESLSFDRSMAGDMRLYNVKDYLQNKFFIIWNIFFTKKRALYKRRLTFELLVQFLPDFWILFVTVQVVNGIITSQRSLGDYALYNGLLTTLAFSITMFISSLVSLYEDQLKVGTIVKFDSYQNKVLDTGTKKLTGDIEIEFKNVSFRYPKTDFDVLKDVSFKIEKYQKICLIGINGAGKSTIIKLLMRFYNVTSGEILINGVNINDYTLESLRNSFSSFFQEFGSFSFTIRENIEISDLKAVTPGTDENILKALKQADGIDLLSKAKHALDTYMSKMFDEDGLEISGGEYQKLALARTIFRSRPFLIFDEPSASLDPESEHNLFNNMQSHWIGKTVLFTSHRLSAVHMADKIIVLEHGKISEQGTHKELMALGGRYHHLYSMQANKYQNNNADEKPVLTVYGSGTYRDDTIDDANNSFTEYFTSTITDTVVRGGQQ